MSEAFDLMKMTLGEFVGQSKALCVRAQDDDMWLAPDVATTQRLVDRGIARERIWTVMEMRQTAEARTVAGLLAMSGIAYGDVIVES
jgi:hypothetical protein